MDTFREGGSLNHAPLLDQSNYAYWKARMSTFINSIIIHGWTLTIFTLEDKTTAPKPENDWSTIDDEASLLNFEAPNAIYNGVDKNVFRLIQRMSQCQRSVGDSRDLLLGNFQTPLVTVIEAWVKALIKESLRNLHKKPPYHYVRSFPMVFDVRQDPESQIEEENLTVADLHEACYSVPEANPWIEQVKVADPSIGKVFY